MSAINHIKRPGGAGACGALLVAILIAGGDICAYGAEAPRTTQRAAPAVAAQKRVPDLDRLPQPQVGVPDVAAIARGFDTSSAAAAAQALVQGPQLLVFISLSMPEGSLRKLVEQAEKVRASLVLRGLKEGSMVKTAAAVRQLLGNRRTGIQIDPQTFDRFGISQVPTFILLRAGTQLQHCGNASCAPPVSYAEVAGDASIDYALEWIGARSEPFRQEANVLLRRLRE